MTNLTSTNTLLIVGIIFLAIAVIGQSKLGFLEINPGCFGRFLALLIGILSLGFAFGLVNLSVETFDLIRTYLAKQVQQNMGLVNDLINEKKVAIADGLSKITN